MLPAKVIPEKGVAYVCHGGEEHPKHDYEVSEKYIINEDSISRAKIPSNYVYRA